MDGDHWEVLKNGHPVTPAPRRWGTGPDYQAPLLALPVTYFIHYKDSSGHACLQPKGDAVTDDGADVTCPKCQRIARRANSKAYGGGWVAPKPARKPRKPRGQDVQVGQVVVYDEKTGRGYKADVTVSKEP
jgi:hypothetical protein